MIKAFLYNILITQQDILDLLRFSDQYRDEKEIKRMDNLIRRFFLISLGLHLLIKLFWVYVAVYSGELSVEENFVQTAFVYILGNVIFSILINRYIYFVSTHFAYKYIYRFLNKVRGFLTDDQQIKATILNREIADYWLKLYTFVDTAVSGIIVMPFIIAIPMNRDFKIGIFLSIIFLVTSLMISGKAWYRLEKVLSEQGSLDNLSKNIKVKRVFYPTVFNGLLGGVYPVILLLVTMKGLSSLTLILAYASPFFTFAWNSIKYYTDLTVTKSALNDLNLILHFLQNKYIINNIAYQKLCDNVSEVEDVKERALLVKNFTPMKITNNEKDEFRTFNLEFNTDIYQLRGYNGVGKTTFLKSLALPNNDLVEYSSGKASCFGEPFFNPKDSLETHRSKYRYLGNRFQGSIEGFDPDYFKKYPSIYEFLLRYQENKHTINSEGENAILGICEVYYKVMVEKCNIRSLFVDEIISRVYSSDDYPLREECIEMIEGMAEERDLVIVVVDHAHHLRNAKKLIMFDDGIEEVNISD